MTTHSTGETVRPDVKVDCDEDRIRLQVEIENGLDIPILVNWRPDDGTRSGEVDRAAYVCVCGDEETLLVSLDPPSPPAGIAYEMGILSLARRLAGGEIYRFDLELRLPDVEWSPYLADFADETVAETAAVQKVRFVTRWFREADLQWSQAGPVEGTFWCQGYPFWNLVEGRRLLDPVRVVRSLPQQLRFC